MAAGLTADDDTQNVRLTGLVTSTGRLSVGVL
jgi:hypothetical protein